MSAWVPEMLPWARPPPQSRLCRGGPWPSTPWYLHAPAGPLLLLLPAPPSTSQWVAAGGHDTLGIFPALPIPRLQSLLGSCYLSLPYLFRGLRLLGVQLGEGFISACPFWQEGTTSFSTPPRQGRDPLAVRTGLCPGGSNCDHTGAETGFRAHGWQHLQLPSDSSPQGRPCPQCPLHPQPLQ